MGNQTFLNAANYRAIMRHFQFADIHNGSWYIEILGGAKPTEFFVQEVRNGVVVRRTAEPKTFAECKKIYWNRTHKMSIEAGNESLPPPIPRIDWK